MSIWNKRAFNQEKVENFLKPLRLGSSVNLVKFRLSEKATKRLVKSSTWCLYLNVKSSGRFCQIIVAFWKTKIKNIIQSSTRKKMAVFVLFLKLSLMVVLKMVFRYQNFCEKKPFEWSKKPLGWSPIICKHFEKSRIIYSNSGRWEQFLVAKCFFNLFLEVSQI